MPRRVFIVGPGRSGTTLLSNLLDRSSQIYIAPETKYLQQVWSQRHLLNLMPRKRRIQKIVDHVISSEYPAEPPTLPAHREQMIQSLKGASNLEEGFLALLDTLSDRTVIGEKTPWHTFFVERIRRIAPNARFVGITRDAPATVASTWRRRGFRRVDSLTQCIARWLLMNQELLDLRERMPRSQFRLILFENLVRDPESVIGEVCELLEVPLERPMLRPTSQDSSLRSEMSQSQKEGFDLGVLNRWREALSPDETRRIRALTWKTSQALGYPAEPAEAGLTDRIAVGIEFAILSGAVRLMHSGFYPFGAATSRQKKRKVAE